MGVRERRKPNHKLFMINQIITRFVLFQTAYDSNAALLQLLQTYLSVARRGGHIEVWNMNIQAEPNIKANILHEWRGSKDIFGYEATCCRGN